MGLLLSPSPYRPNMLTPGGKNRKYYLNLRCISPTQKVLFEQQLCIKVSIRQTENENLPSIIFQKVLTSHYKFVRTLLLNLD